MKMLIIFLDLLNITFFYQTNCFSSLFPDVHGLGSGKILSSHSFCCFFPYFSNGRPLSIFHPPPISYPTLRSPPILAVRFPFSCILDVFPPLSLLVCLHPSLLCGLPIPPCFSPIFLFSCPVASHLSSGRSSFFRQPFLFLLFDEPITKLAAAVVVLSTPLSPDTDTGMLV